jgi:hypothetical protein
MKHMRFIRPTTHYDERISQIDEKICELIKQRKVNSDNNSGCPPFELITKWAEKYDLYEDLLKSLFGSLCHDKVYKPVVEPEGFRKNLPVLKFTEEENRLYSVISIGQFSNSSIINFNIDWNNPSDLSEHKYRNFELYIDEQYDCRMINGTGGETHFHYSFIVSPPLPDNTSGIELVFKEYDMPFNDKQTGHDIVIRL